MADEPRLDQKDCPHTGKVEVYPEWYWCPDCWLLQGSKDTKFKLIAPPHIFEQVEGHPESKSMFFKAMEKIADNPESGTPIPKPDMKA